MSINEMERDYLVNEMEILLNEYDYSYENRALALMINEWASEKAPFINAFKKHPNYVEGKFLIAFDCDYERKIDPEESRVFYRWLSDNAMPKKELLPKEIVDRTDPFSCLPDGIFNFFYWLNNYAERCISESTASYLNCHVPEIHAHAGQKTSRVVNKLCTYLGYSTVEGYNKAFARYADSLSPMTIKRHTVISINPLDYLTMSFGNSWSSCHTIDKDNKRRMPNGYEGQYSSGTVSYMLDPSSFILYTVDANYNGTDYWTQPKINRQMFHWGEDKLVQARLYPQDNDSNGDAYTPYRNIVQEVMAKIFDFPNLWTISKGNDKANKYIIGRGTNYQDYRYYSNVTLSRIKGSENENMFQVGARPICIECGCRHDYEENISCCSDEDRYVCEDCGDRLDEDDVYWVDGYAYCRDCVSYCEWCEEYHRGDEHWIADREMWVCDTCYCEDFEYCDECGDNVREATYIESEDIHVCRSCRARYFTLCYECGEYVRDSEVVTIDGNQYCERCAEEHSEEEKEVC